MGEGETYETLTVAPRTLLGALVGRAASGSERNWRYKLLFGAGESLLYPVMQRMWNDRVGGLVLYALGVRTLREMERIARKRR